MMLGGWPARLLGISWSDLFLVKIRCAIGLGRANRALYHACEVSWNRGFQGWTGGGTRGSVQYTRPNQFR